MASEYEQKEPQIKNTWILSKLNVLRFLGVILGYGYGLGRIRLSVLGIVILKRAFSTISCLVA